MDNLRPFDFPMSVPDYELWFVGSCNGLLCISIDPETLMSLVLYNPSTRKLKTLPVSRTDKETSSYFSYGFCYDDISEDYKVVKLNVVSNQESMYRIEVKVYSLRNDSWIRIGDGHDGRIDSITGGKYVGGGLHWLICSNDESYLIFAVNTVADMYGTLEPPNDGVADLSIGEVNGCLGVFCNYYEIRVDVWAMKEYGITESWSKVVSIPCPVNPSAHIWPSFVNDEFRFDYEPSIEPSVEPSVMIYNSKTNSFRRREIHNVGGPCLVANPPFVESLVPPSFVGE